MQLKTSVPHAIYSQSAIINEYTDSAGFHTDDIKSGRMKVIRQTYNSSTESHNIDSGRIIGTYISPDEPSVADNYVSEDITFNPLLSVTTTNPYTAKHTTKLPNGVNSAFQTNWNKISIGNYVIVKWRTNLTVNGGTLSSLVCSVKESAFWKLKWTGAPMIDYYITKAGKQIAYASLDFIMQCNTSNAAPLDYYFDWELTFNTTFNNGWNYILGTIVDVTVADWLDYSMIPWVGVTSTRQPRSANIQLYPELPRPTAPQLELEQPQNETELATSLTEPKKKKAKTTIKSMLSVFKKKKTSKTHTQ